MITRDRFALVALVALVALASIAPSRAFAESDDEATRLFKQGKSLLADGHIAEACAAFDKSDAIAPSIGNLLNLGECREQNQQIATAYAAFQRAAALAQRTPNEHARADEARRRAGYLQPRLSYLTISVAEGSLIDGLTIARDGAPVERAYWNQGVPVDGGTYVIEARVPGQEAWRTSVMIPPENGRVSVEIPRLKSLDALSGAIEPSRAAHREARAAVDEVETVETASAPHASSRFTRLRVVALGLGAASVAAFGTATYAGLSARSASADAWARCPSEPCTDPEGLRLGERAHDRARLTNIALGVGAVTTAAAVTLWIVGRPSRSHAARIVPHVGADHVGVSLHLEL
jgi:hypothetical protein